MNPDVRLQTGNGEVGCTIPLGGKRYTEVYVEDITQSLRNYDYQSSINKQKAIKMYKVNIKIPKINQNIEGTIHDLNGVSVSWCAVSALLSAVFTPPISDVNKHYMPFVLFPSPVYQL